MVDGIHRDSAHLGAASHPATAASLAKGLVLVFGVGDFAHCGHARQPYIALLLALHAQEREAARFIPLQ